MAAEQHGAVSRRQLRAIGWSDNAISRAVGDGWLHRVFPGAYTVGYPHSGERVRMRAAVLACGDGSVVSHRSAGALLGLLDKAPVVVDLIAPGSRGEKIDGIRAHDVRRVRIAETGSLDGIPCTSPARTLVDVAGTVGARTLRSMFERAAARKLLDLDAIEASMTPGRRGMPALRVLIEEWRQAAPVAATQRLKSPLEAMVLPLLMRRGAPAPRSNAPVLLVEGRIEVDFLWEERRFVLEADSRDFHATDVAFERDRWRDRELLRAGYSSLRVTRLQAEREAEAVADAVWRRLVAQEEPTDSQRREIS
jgi:hypothetical protein